MKDAKSIKNDYNNKMGLPLAFLIAVDLENNKTDWNSFDSIQELSELAITAGLTVYGSLIQKREYLDEKYYLGKGKLAEIKEIVIENQIEVLIADDELSPVQEKNLEKYFGIKIIDRTALILDIFAARAHTHEAQLQVELAQLTYLMPRLTRMWEHLSRLGGGIGTRGPGEKQLEVDKRRIKDRIAHLKKNLKEVSSIREIQRRKRQDLPIFSVCLIGYTNAGKSTLLNQLTKANVLTEDKLFATLDPTTRRLQLPNNDTVLLTDTVGFIKKLPHQLINAFHATLEAVIYSDLLLQVVDVSHEKYMSFIETAKEILKELDAENKPMVLVMNKIDRVKELEAQRHRGDKKLERLGGLRGLAPLENLSSPEVQGAKPLEKPKSVGATLAGAPVKTHGSAVVHISALKKENLDCLLFEIQNALKENYQTIELDLNYNQQDVINLIYEYGKVLKIKYLTKKIKIKAEINKCIMEKITGQFLR